VHEGLTAKDQVLLTEIQQRAVRFFVDQTDSDSGLTRDRAPTNGARGSAASSIAATGFALTAWCIADERGWLSNGEALQRIRETVRFVLHHHAHEHGWFYHFVDPQTGERAGRVRLQPSTRPCFCKAHCWLANTRKTGDQRTR
jgi:hypothetical protein